MSKHTRHIGEFVEALAGPAIYLGFFGLAYFAAALICPLSSGNDPLLSEPQSVIGGTILVLTIVALFLLAVIAIDALRRLAGQKGDQQDTFLALLTVALAAFSALAVIWTALPASIVVPVC